jgi:hypothetical protein
MARHEGWEGVWVIYGWDSSPYPVGIYVEERLAIENHQSGYGIAFWRFNTEFQDAIRLWESRNQEVKDD